LMLPLKVQKFQHPSAPSKEPPKKWRCRKFKSRKELLVDLIGIEPMTSSMPSRRGEHTLSLDQLKIFVLALNRRHQFIDGSREEPVVKGQIIQGGRGRHEHHVVERCDQYAAVKQV
jgi:hypothetical protein